MRAEQIDQFFAIVADELPRPARVIITGAAAGALWGHVRPSLDIDFAIMPARKGALAWETIEEAVERAKQRTGIAASYAIDFDRWGAISLLDYRRHTARYKTFGALTVELLDPAYWSIGKLTRFYEPDVDDLVAVLTHRRIRSEPLLRLWGTALRKSPPSSDRTLFKAHVESFLRLHGARIWGAAFKPDLAIEAFLRHARRSRAS